MEEQLSRLVDQVWQGYQNTPKNQRFSEFRVSHVTVYLACTDCIIHILKLKILILT